MERDNSYEIEARVELPVVRGGGRQAMQDIVVNIDTEGREGRLFGLVLDTLGGTYRLELENCRLLTVDEQDGTDYDDYCNGISIPSVVVPLATATEIVGGNTINEPAYNMSSLLSVIDRYRFSYMPLEEGRELFAQAGSIITYCVMPSDISVPCRIRFVKVAENGREYNMKRFITETITDEYDISGGGTYAIVEGNRGDCTLRLLRNGSEVVPNAEGIIGGEFAAEDSVVLAVSRPQHPLLFSRIKNNQGEDDYGLLAYIQAPLTDDLVRFVNRDNGSHRFAGFFQTNGYNSALPAIDKIKCESANNAPIRVCANVHNFEIRGEFGNTELSLHEVETEDIGIVGTGCDFLLFGELKGLCELRGSFFKVEIKPEAINESARLSVYIGAKDFYLKYSGNIEPMHIKGYGGSCYIDNTGGSKKEVTVESDFESISTYGPCGSFSLSNGASRCKKLIYAKDEIFRLTTDETPSNLALLQVSVEEDKYELHSFLEKIYSINGYKGMSTLEINFGRSTGKTADEWDVLLAGIIDNIGTGLDLATDTLSVDFGGMDWMFSDLYHSATYMAAVARTTGSDNVRIRLPFGTVLESHSR